MFAQQYLLPKTVHGGAALHYITCELFRVA